MEGTTLFCLLSQSSLTIALQYDRRHGKGKETDPSGAVYYGCWRSGEKHGFGKLVWPNAPKWYVAPPLVAQSL